MKYVLIVIAIISFASCKKNTKPKSLPAITQIGANTFGCKINGEIYSVIGAYESNHVGCASGNYIAISTLSPSINSSSCNDAMPFDGVALFLNEAYSIKTYNLKGSGFSRGSCTKTAPSISYYTDSTYVGELVLTRADNVIAGTFWFDAIGSDGSVVHITEGRFDISK